MSTKGTPKSLSKKYTKARVKRITKCLTLTEGQWELVKEMLYEDTQVERFNGAASRAIYEEIERR